MVSLRILVLAQAVAVGIQGVAGYGFGGYGLQNGGVEEVRHHGGNVEHGGSHGLKHRSSEFKHDMSPVHPRDTCETICKPKLCVGPVVLDGTSTQLTYLCPETATPTDRATVFVTITEEVTVTPTTTVVGSNGIGGAATSAEVTTTVTIQTVSVVSKTITVFQPTHATFAAPISELKSSAIVSSESGKPEQVGFSTFSMTLDESTTTVTEHRISTILLTITLSGHHSTSTIHSPVPPFPNTTTHGSVPTPVFPSLVLSSSANGTIIDGVSYTGHHGASGSASGFTATGTGIGYAPPITRRDQAGIHGQSTIVVTHTITQVSTTTTTTQADGGKGGSYPGAVTQKLGKGLAGRASVSFMALILALAGAVILL